jgi:acyl carrier protein
MGTLAAVSVLDHAMRVKCVVAELLGMPVEQINTDQRLGDDLGADSLDKVELLLALEDEFRIDITDEEAEKFETVGDIVRYVQGKTGG